MYPHLFWIYWENFLSEEYEVNPKTNVIICCTTIMKQTENKVFSKKYTVEGSSSFGRQRVSEINLVGTQGMC